ncbi:YIP1 family protein [bacterium]|nr:YIP1 family protein [bacterium]MCG2676838.1 YIP1 family protein [bacterium]
MKLIERIGGAVVSPKKTFEYLSSNPDWKGPFLLMLVSIFMGAGLMIMIFRNMPAEIGVPKVVMLVGSIAGLVAVLIGLYLGWLIRTAFIYLFGNIAKGKARFYSLFSVVGYAWIPLFIRSLLYTVVFTIRSPVGLLSCKSGSCATAMSAMRVPTNLAFFFPVQPTSPLFTLLNQIDLFLFWGLALMVLGVFCVFKFNLKKSILIVFSYWILVTACHTGFLSLMWWLQKVMMNLGG